MKIDIEDKEKYLQHINENYKKAKNPKIYSEKEIENYRLLAIENYKLLCYIIGNNIKYENMTKEEKDCYDDGPGTTVDYIRSLGYEAC